jgi:hypothetical protein
MGVFITQKGSSIQPSLQMEIARKVQRTQCTDRVLLPRHYRHGLHCPLPFKEPCMAGYPLLYGP